MTEYLVKYYTKSGALTATRVFSYSMGEAESIVRAFPDFGVIAGIPEKIS